MEQRERNLNRIRFLIIVPSQMVQPVVYISNLSHRPTGIRSERQIRQDSTDHESFSGQTDDSRGISTRQTE